MEKTPSGSQGNTQDMSRLEQEVASSLVDGQLPCAVAFRIARELGVSLREIGETTDSLGVRIINCQLGCFP